MTNTRNSIFYFAKYTGTSLNNFLQTMDIDLGSTPERKKKLSKKCQKFLVLNCPLQRGSIVNGYKYVIVNGYKYVIS